MSRMLRLLPLLLSCCCFESRADFMADTARRFAESDIEFQRSGSLVPFMPLAAVTASRYDDTDAEFSDGTNLEYDLETVSQYAILPILASPRDALFVGEYLGYSHFEVSGDDLGNFDVTTVGLPLGWLRQASTNWQLAGFVMPVAHKSNLEEADWSYQVMGGAFARHQASDNVWWLYGLYFDIAPEDNYLIPYIGASWSINDHWTLSVVLPWPALLYAPNRDWLLSLGASPSGASWNVSSGQDDVSINYDAWDLDLRVERRIHGNFWLGARVGAGAMRGVRLSSGDFDWPDVDVGSSGYFSITLNFRPGNGTPSRR